MTPQARDGTLRAMVRSRVLYALRQLPGGTHDNPCTFRICRRPDKLVRPPFLLGCLMVLAGRRQVSKSAELVVLRLWLAVLSRPLPPRQGATCLR